jgi:NAD(P)-dependent dehydrogenase (short-subunit alcohol dehydrogenase family)
MPSALIVGASRGIGYEFVRQYLADHWTVYATFRSEDDRLKLRELGAHTLKLDVLELTDVAGISWQLDGETFDVVVNNAGVYGPRASTTKSPPTQDEFDAVMRTNVLAAMRMIPVVAPLLTAKGGTLAFVSSRMGSISEAGASTACFIAPRRRPSICWPNWPTPTTRRSACGCWPCIRAGYEPTWADRMPMSTWPSVSKACAASLRTLKPSQAAVFTTIVVNH